MFSRIGYFLRETFTSIGRNWAMAIAGVLVIAVTMLMAGGGLMYTARVANGTQRWKNGARLEVFMTKDASQQQIEGVEQAIKSSSDVKSFVYISKRQAYTDFKRIFNDQPDLVNSISEDTLPVSFRVTPRKAELTNELGTRFGQLDGVDQAITPGDQLKKELRQRDNIKKALWALSAVLFVTSLIIVATTIRLATYARRREIEVMKLVGASNWFVRVPFLTEGVMQGVVGGILASGVLVSIAWAWLVSNPRWATFAKAGYTVSGGDVVFTLVFVMVGSILAGLVAALIGLWRFLDV